MEQLVIAVDKESADYRRIGHNSLWEYVREYVVPIFGPLTYYAADRLREDKYLSSCYVKDFVDHADEKAILSRLQNIIMPSDLSFYSDFKDWVETKKHYLEGTLGYFKEFKLMEMKVAGQPKVLCGRKGSGKTTLLLFSRHENERLSNVRCIFISLSSPSFAEGDPMGIITTEIVQGIDRLVLDAAKERSIPDEERVIECFKPYWELNAIYPFSTDTPQKASRKQQERDKHLRILATQKYSKLFIPYILNCICFFKTRLEGNLAIIIDDVDRLESEKVAKAVFDRAAHLAKHLPVPVTVSVREETLAKLSDIPMPPRKVHVVPPSFAKALKKRLETFNNEFKISPEYERESGYSTNTARIFVNHIVESVLQNEVYVNLIAYHYDLDVLMDVVRCLIASPYLEPRYVLSLVKQNEWIPWHIVLNSMQLYVYKNFYDQNSFILNVYDNGERSLEEITTANNLIRVRLLQVLRHLYTGLDVFVQVGEIYASMIAIGYEKTSVIRALDAFAQQRLIVTLRYRNTFTEDVDSIIIERTVAYYLDHLIYTYRYLQNILPVTPVNFKVPWHIFGNAEPLVSEKLAIVSESLKKFVEFIRIAEKKESPCIKDRDFFVKITRGQVLSDTIESKLNHEISDMKGVSYKYR